MRDGGRNPHPGRRPSEDQHPASQAAFLAYARTHAPDVVEQAASPLTTFLIGPITQLVFIPFMTDGAGADWIGGWFGTGPDRGMALVFVLTGVLGLVVTVLARQSRFYRQLSGRYR